jgi:predicted MFS family arabinose efflux permease
MTQIGYATGLLVFVPLGDMVERRALILRLFTGAALALFCVALSTSFAFLILASALTGLFASVTHVVLPLASDVVADGKRGNAIGTVMTGLLSGILAARTFAGWIGNLYGWRAVFLTAGAINVSLAFLIWENISAFPPKQRLGYQSVMSSLYTLLRSKPLLRESCAIGALTFASFGCFWTTVTFLLKSQYNLGAGPAGTLGLAGIAGALVAPFAGLKADRRGSRHTISIGLAILAVSYLIIWAGVAAKMRENLHLTVLVVGVVVLDLGAQITQVANQTRVFGLDASARSRLNTIYMTIYFSGGALGSWLAAKVWSRWQSNGVFSAALIFLALASIRHRMGSSARPQTLNSGLAPLDSATEGL